MQSRGILLAVLFTAVIFSISGLLPSASAAQLQLNQDNCENYLGGTWSSSTCTIPASVEAEIGLEEDEETADILIISGPVTLLLEEDSSLTISGGIESLGTIENNGSITIEEDAGILNLGSFINSETGYVENYFDFVGSGTVDNAGEITLEDGDFNPAGLMTNSGLITINEGEFSVGNLITNTVDGEIDNYAGLTVRELDNFGTITNNQGALMDIAGGGTNSGVLTNHPGSFLINHGNMDLDPTGEFLHFEGFSSSATSDIELGGLITNHDTMTNNGNLNIKFSGTFVL